jgi:hypothetical protein
VYKISDIIRGAEHVVVLAGNPTQPNPPRYDEALKDWGRRVWTLPEILLSRGNTISTMDPWRKRLVTMDKDEFMLQAWTDCFDARQLLDHYRGNIQLSRLEFVKIALGCLMNRELEKWSDGDMSYALMGLLRIRPPVDRTDTSFQAFARYVVLRSVSAACPQRQLIPRQSLLAT